MTEQQGTSLYGYDATVPHFPGEESALRYYLNILRRRLWTVTAVLVVAVTAGLIRAFRSPPVYRAVAKILVERQMPRLVNFDSVVEGYTGWDPEFFRTQAELARSRVVMEAALEQPGIAEMFHASASSGKPESSSFLGELRATILALLGAVPAPAPEPWEIMRGNIGSQHMADTHFILVSSEGLDPKRVAALANAVSRAFADYHVKRRAQALSDAYLFLDQERNKEEKSLLDAEKELQRFRETAREVPLYAPEQEQPTLKRLAELSEKLTEVQLKRIAAMAQLKAVEEILRSDRGNVKKQIANLFALPEIRADVTVSAVHDSLVKAEERSEQLAGTYGPDHPLMKDAKADAERLGAQFRESLNQLVLSQLNQLKILKNEEAELIRQQDEEKTRALSLAKEVFTFSGLDNTVKRHRRLLDALTERMREVDVSAGFVKTNAQVTEEAGVPSAPVRPKRLNIIMMAMFMGLALGMGLAFLCENLDDTIKTPEDLKERIGIPLLGFVPRIEMENGKQQGQDTTMPRGVVTLLEPVSSVAEAYRNIRTRLLFSIPAGETRVLGFTSCSPGEGKTTTSTNLALVMAMAGKEVLLVDADIHRPMVHRILQLENSQGLTSVLTGAASETGVVQQVSLQETGGGKLDIMSAGPESPNPAELLGSDRMRVFLTWARKKYDWVFVDIPPILFISDASIVSALCEGIVLVIRSGKNNRSMLLRTKSQLEELKIRVVGSVLNDVVLSRLGRYYSDYAYYGYSRYSSNYHKSYYGDKDRPPDGNDGRPDQAQERTRC